MSSAASADNSAVRHVNIALYNSGKVLDDKANNKEGPDLNLVNGGKVNEDLLKDLLKTYEQAKLKMAGAFLQNSIDLRNSGLGQALQNDPVFQSLVQPTPTTAKISPEATLNFFKLVFKFLKDHKDDDSKIEVAQAMNMLVKENGLDDIDAFEQHQPRPDRRRAEHVAREQRQHCFLDAEDVARRHEELAHGRAVHSIDVP